MKTIKSIGCGDWMKTWGLGTNKVGKLQIIIEPDCPINFLWKGHSQGRHGNTWNKGANLRFMKTDEGYKVTQKKGDAPDQNTLAEAANILLRANGFPELPIPVYFFE